MLKYKGTEYKCSMDLTIDLIGGKWKALILWQIGEKTLRFGELRKTLPKVTQKMLTQQLRELESNGLVHRFVYTQVPPKVEYSLTEVGKSLLPILSCLCQWGLEFINKVESVNKEDPC